MEDLHKYKTKKQTKILFNICATQVPGVAGVAGGWTGRDLTDPRHLLRPLSSPHSRPLSHDSAPPGFVLKLNFNFIFLFLFLISPQSFQHFLRDFCLFPCEYKINELHFITC